MTIVVDASMTLGWIFEDEEDEYAEEVLRKFQGGRVPALWPLEVVNGLLVAHRRKRLNPAQLKAGFNDLGQFPIMVEAPPAAAIQRGVLELAMKHNLSAYDAAYLELAIRDSLPLATLDAKLQAACKKAGVVLAFTT